MPLSNDGCLIAGFAKQFRKRLLRSVEVVSIVHEAIFVAVLSRNDDCAAGTTNGVCAKTILKQHALSRKRVDVWCWVNTFEPTVVSPDCVRSMIIGKDENDIGLLGFGIFNFRIFGRYRFVHDNDVERKRDKRRASQPAEKFRASMLLAVHVLYLSRLSGLINEIETS